MRWLVCGGRDFYDRDRLWTFLNNYKTEQGVEIYGVITGMARGADALARDWAFEQGIQTIELQANWQKHGKRAGWLRNISMADLEPDVVIAFPGGRGTAMMLEIAKTCRIPVVRA